MRYETGASQPGDRRRPVPSSAWPGGRSVTTGVVRAGAIVIAAGGFVMNPDMVAEYTPALGAKLVHARLDVRRRAGHPARDVGRRRPQAHGRAVHHRTLLPAVGAGHRAHRQLRWRAFRGRGLLPRTDIAVRDGTARLTRPTSSSTARTWSSRRCRWCRSSTAMRPSPRWRQDSACRPGRWKRHWPGTTSTPPAERTRTSTRAPTGWHHRTRARGRSSTCDPARRSTPGSPSGVCAPPSTAQVQRPDGSVIPGLYAAGACASNIAQDGKGYGSGTQLGEGSFFGRRAGRHAAQLLPVIQQLLKTT